MPFCRFIIIVKSLLWCIICTNIYKVYTHYSPPAQQCLFIQLNKLEEHSIEMHNSRQPLDRLTITITLTLTFDL